MARPPSDEEFTEFVHASWPGLYRTAYLLLGDPGEAEDLVQTALAKTYGSWHKVRDLGAAPAYARTTMLNTASSWFRKKSWRNERPTEHLPDGGLTNDPSDRPAVMQALAQLPERQRAVVVLRYFEDLDVATTAQTLGISSGTVKSQTFEALGRLRDLLGEAVVPDPLESTLGTGTGASHD